VPPSSGAGEWLVFYPGQLEVVGKSSFRARSVPDFQACSCDFPGYLRQGIEDADTISFRSRVKQDVQTRFRCIFRLALLETKAMRPPPKCVGGRAQ
jgi:hypothetical protein